VTSTPEARLSRPALTRLDVAAPRALVLVLHGGKPRSLAPVDGHSLSLRRARALHGTLAPRFAEAGLSTWLLTYRVRGWNGGGDPVDDARWALAEVRREVGALPVVLLGHSMGARVAVHVADDPRVAGVVGLAPWWPADDPVSTLAGTRLVGAHGRRDRITSSSQSARFVDRAARVAASAQLLDMGPVGHYLLRRTAAWHEVAETAVRAIVGAMVTDPGDR
jgi:predicted esterase